MEVRIDCGLHNLLQEAFDAFLSKGINSILSERHSFDGRQQVEVTGDGGELPARELGVQLGHRTVPERAMKSRTSFRSASRNFRVSA
jgi:hypothetical protein